MFYGNISWTFNGQAIDKVGLLISLQICFMGNSFDVPSFLDLKKNRKPSALPKILENVKLLAI